MIQFFLEIATTGGEMDHSSIAQTENQTALATQNGNIYYFPTKDIDGIADIDAALQKNQNQIDTLSLRFLREQIEADTIVLLMHFTAMAIVGSSVFIAICIELSTYPVILEMFLLSATFVFMWGYLFDKMRRKAREKGKVEAQLIASNGARKDLYREQKVRELRQQVYKE